MAGSIDSLGGHIHRRKSDERRIEWHSEAFHTLIMVDIIETYWFSLEAR